MITLGLDSSGKTLSLALARDREILVEYNLAMGYKHSVTLQPMVRDILNASSLTLNEVDLFAVACGPGSFTGIRIGLSAVKGMAYATGARVLPLSSLEALARSAGPFRGLTAPLLDARGDRVYSSLYRDGRPLVEEAPRPLNSLPDLVADHLMPGEGLLVTGDGTGLVAKRQEILDGLPGSTILAPMHARSIRASAIIDLALDRLEEGFVPLDPFDLEASYLLASSAERETLKGHD